MPTQTQALLFYLAIQTHIRQEIRRDCIDDEIFAGEVGASAGDKRARNEQYGRPKGAASRRRRHGSRGSSGQCPKETAKGHCPGPRGGRGRQLARYTVSVVYNQ